MTENMYGINNESNGVEYMYVTTSITHKPEVRIGLLTFKQIVNNFVLEPYSKLRPVQTLATLLANKTQHCWARHVASICTPCCVLLCVVATGSKLLDKV